MERRRKLNRADLFRWIWNLNFFPVSKYSAGLLTELIYLKVWKGFANKSSIVPFRLCLAVWQHNYIGTCTIVQLQYTYHSFKGGWKIFMWFLQKKRMKNIFVIFQIRTTVNFCEIQSEKIVEKDHQISLSIFHLYLCLQLFSAFSLRSYLHQSLPTF